MLADLGDLAPGDVQMPLPEESASTTRISQRHRCLMEVLRRPGQTAAEIAVATGLRRHAPSRRLAELRQQGRVTHGPTRPCRITGNPSTTWFAAAETPS